MTLCSLVATAGGGLMRLQRRLRLNSSLSTADQSISQSKRIYIAPYVAGESEARVGLG